MSNIIEVNPLENHGKPVVTRAEAKALGKDTYFTGKHCKHEHLSERYVADRQCIVCRTEKDAKRIASGENAAKNKRWQATNPDRHAASGGWKDARKRGATLPPDFSTPGDLITATVGFYQEARRLTEETRVMHHVDHRIPLSAGGLHHPSNLRVVTAAFNRAKRNLTDLQCLNAILKREWRGPADDATIAMLVHSVTFTNAGVALAL